MLTDAARLSITAKPAVAGSCSLCAVDAVQLMADVVIDHPHGGSVRFEACERCSRAARRIAAAIGGRGDVVSDGQQTIAESSHPVHAEPRGRVILVREELGGFVNVGTATRYDVRVYGESRADGTWIGWIEFRSPETGAVLRTGRETTQSNEGQLAYWASGLGVAYFEGAFERAH